MGANEIRKTFLDFFQKRGHRVVPSSSLIPDDPSVLLTTAGMQQFKPYFVGKADPMRDFGSKNTASVQKSFRTSDIDEVGDESHLTFFEMLGNFSFGYKPGEPVSPKGGYFKEDAIKYGHEFITKEMGLSISYVSVFEGDPSTSSGQVVLADTESEEIWKSLGVTNIKRFGRADNFWGPTGAEGPCGPTTEIYVKSAGGKDIEIWNIVFNEFYCHPDKSLTKLETPGVDTGMGLERLAMVSQEKPTIFDTDLFRIFHPHLLGNLGREEETRILADHVRASVFLLSDGVRPSNKEAGYVLRRLIRRAMMQSRRTGFSEQSLLNLIDGVISDYGSFYKELKQNKDIIKEEFNSECARFEKTLALGVKEFFEKFPEMIAGETTPDPKSHTIKRISGDDAFYFQQSHGLTLDVIKDLARDGGHIVEVNEQEFEEAIRKHKEVSRAGQEKKFGGHGLILNTGELKAANEEEVKKVTRLHTATHLLQASLRKVLGGEVKQAGSDITAERTRFDFTFPRKVTKEELKKIEDMANSVAASDFDVIMEEMAYEDAIQKGALAFFKEKYPERVSVYSVVGKDGEVFSRELCGGPHVTHTKEIGKITIVKEESSSAGVRRIRAIIEP